MLIGPIDEVGLPTTCSFSKVDPNPKKEDISRVQIIIDEIIMPFIDVIQPREVEGKLKEIYRQLEQRRGKIAEVHKIQSLNPESIPRHMDLYMTLMFGKSPLKRYQRDMTAVVVSAANQCEYCQLHHGEGLNHFWKDEAKIEKLRDDYTTAGLDEADTLLCKVAEQWTRDPPSGNKEAAEELKAAGFSDPRHPGCHTYRQLF